MLTILNPTSGIDRSRARRADQSGVDRSVAAAIWNRAVCGTSRTCRSRGNSCDNGRITGVVVRQQGRAPWCRATTMSRRSRSSASPRCRTSGLLAADPRSPICGTLAPNVEWMNGVQFYLHRDLPIAHGHVIHIDTEWALTSVSQLQFWRNVPPELFGDSEVHGILSVDVSDWTAPGSNGRPAMQCSREEVVRETWSAAEALDQRRSKNCCATRICTRGSSIRTLSTIPQRPGLPDAIPSRCS